jgi:hypothetical protein
MPGWAAALMERTLQEETITEKPFYRRTWLVVLAAVALVFVLALVVLPYGISYGLHQWLTASGDGDVQLEDIDFNVFTGRASVTDLNIAVDGQPRLIVPRLELDVDWLPLFSKHVDARSITLDSVYITIAMAADSTLRMGVISLPTAEDKSEEATGEAWGFRLEQLDIINTTVTYQSPDLQLVTHIASLKLSHLVSWMTDPARLVLNAVVNDAPVLLDGELPPLSEGFGFSGKLSVTSLPLHPFATLAAAAVDGLDGQLNVSTELDVLLTPANSLTLSHTGLFGLDGLTLEQAGRQLSYAGLQWQGEMKLATAIDSGGLELELQGVITGKDLGVADKDIQVSYAGQQWTGALSLNTAGGNGKTDIKLQGKLGGDGLAVLVPAEQLSVYYGDLLWDGAVAVAAGEDTAVAAEGSLQIGKLGADVADKKVNLASINNLTVEKLQLLENGDIVVTGLAINDAVFAKNAVVPAGKESKDGSVLSAGLITADSIEVTAGNQIAIGLLEWRDVVSFVQRDSNGEWRPVRIVHTLPFTNTDEDAPPEAKSADAPAGRVRVDELRITGDSAMILDDKTVKPPFNMRLTFTEAVMKNIDNGKIDQDSPLTIKARISKHSHISVKGTMQPFAARPTLDLVNHVDGISLPQLTPYTVAALGYALKSGHLDADSTLKINKGVIDSRNNLVIRGLEISPVDNESREKLDGSLSVSLDTALGMLRDKNDTIKLDLPVSGDIDSPDFEISDIINTAVSKAVMQGSMTYLKFALQPYGALITVAELAGEAATKVRLQPVNFEAGQAVPAGESDSYLEKVAGILEERPEINIKICGLAVAADRAALGGGSAVKDAKAKTDGSDKDVVAATDQQLLGLASKRAGFVKDRLVIKYGVTASRLVACTPEIDDSEDDDSVPRVDLLI